MNRQRQNFIDPAFGIGQRRQFTVEPGNRRLLMIGHRVVNARVYTLRTEMRRERITIRVRITYI